VFDAPDNRVHLDDTTTHEERYEKLRGEIKTGVFAKCQSRYKSDPKDPNQKGGPYPDLDDPKSELAFAVSECRCKNKADEYAQFSTYVERGTAILDDNPENEQHKFKTTYNFNKPGSYAFFDPSAQGYRFSQVGATRKFVRYNLLGFAEKKQEYRRRVSISNVNECECPKGSADCSLENFEHNIYGSQCHAYATCTDLVEGDSSEHPYTDLSNSEWTPAHPSQIGITRFGYQCACKDGFGGNGFSSDVTNGNGCTDNVSPSIDLQIKGEDDVPAGQSVAYIDTTCCCKDTCGDGHCQDAKVSDKVKVSASDRNDGQYSQEGPFDLSGSVTVTATEKLTCKDIPTEGVAWRDTKWYDQSLCQKEPNLCVHRITYSVSDDAGNKAEDRYVYIIQKPVQVLARLEEVENMLKAQLAEKDATIKELESQLEEEKSSRKKDQAAVENNLADVQKTATATESKRQENEEDLKSIKSNVPFLMLVALVLGSSTLIVALYNNWLGTMCYMIAALLFPSSLSQRNFEIGYDAYLRILGQHRVDRNRNVATQYARVVDGGQGPDFVFLLIVLVGAAAGYAYTQGNLPGFN
jgi:hypothetical protein